MKAIYKEKLLLHKIQEYKDSEAFGELYDLYVSRIYRFVFLKTSNREDAEDLTSDVFLKTWNYLVDDSRSGQDRIKSFSGLVYRIARNTLVDYYRKKSVRKEYTLDLLENVGGYSKELAKVEIDHEMLRILQVLKKMKKEYQEVIVFKYIEELSAAEIANILQKSQTNVRVTLHRAMKVLKSLLDEKISF